MSEVTRRRIGRIRFEEILAGMERGVISSPARSQEWFLKEGNVCNPQARREIQWAIDHNQGWTLGLCMHAMTRAKWRNHAVIGNQAWEALGNWMGYSR